MILKLLGFKHNKQLGTNWPNRFIRELSLNANFTLTCCMNCCVCLQKTEKGPGCANLKELYNMFKPIRLFQTVDSKHSIEILK